MTSHLDIPSGGPFSAFLTHARTNISSLHANKTVLPRLQVGGIGTNTMKHEWRLYSKNTSLLTLDRRKGYARGWEERPGPFPGHNHDLAPVEWPKSRGFSLGAF